MSDLEGVCFTRLGEHLVPSDIHADEFLEKVKPGKEVIVTMRRARNPKHHRTFFAVLKMVVDNSDDWPSVDVLLDEIKMGLGLYEVRFCLFTGRPYARPKSIAFAAMGQDEFKQFFDAAMHLLASKIGYDPLALLFEYERSVELRSKKQ